MSNVATVKSSEGEVGPLFIRKGNKQDAVLLDSRQEA